MAANSCFLWLCRVTMEFLFWSPFGRVGGGKTLIFTFNGVSFATSLVVLENASNEFHTAKATLSRVGG